MSSKSIDLSEDSDIDNAENNISSVADDFNEVKDEDTGITNENNNNKNIRHDEECFLKYSGQPRKVEINLEVFKCHLCAFNTNRRYKLIRHYKHHSKKLPFECEYCGKGFRSQNALQNHLNHHNGVKPYGCKFCSMSFASPGEVIRHSRYRHTREKPHKCKECDYATVELSKLRRHFRIHTGERPYQCPHCTYAAGERFNLKRHINQHFGEKPYKCEKCETKFTQLDSLKSHLKLHNDFTLTYKCKMCPSKFKYAAYLNKHMSIQHSFCAMYCNLCEMSYPDRYTYKAHKKIHMAQKRFKCDICSHECTRMKLLIKHMHRHLEKKLDRDQHSSSFRFKNEDKNEKKSDNLSNKQKKEHICDYCHRSYAYKGNLIKHLVMHQRDTDESLNVKKEDETCDSENTSFLEADYTNKSIGYWTPLENEIIKEVNGNEEYYIFHLLYVGTDVHETDVIQQIKKSNDD